MAWSNSLNNKFAKIHPKEEEKKKDSSFYDDYKARSGSNNNSVSFTLSVKAKTGGSAGSSTVSKQSGGGTVNSKKAAPTTVLGNDTKYFSGFKSYQDRKKTGNVFTPSRVLEKYKADLSKQTADFTKNSGNIFGKGSQIELAKINKMIYQKELDNFEDVRLNNVPGEMDRQLRSLVSTYNRIKKHTLEPEKQKEILNLVSDNKNLLREYSKITGHAMNAPEMVKLNHIEKTLLDQRNDNEIMSAYNKRMKEYEEVEHEEDFALYANNGTASLNSVTRAFDNAFSGREYLKNKVNSVFIPYKEAKYTVEDDKIITEQQEEVGEPMQIFAAVQGDEKLLYMSKKEQRIYNYYINKYGKEKAEEYLDDLKIQLDERYAKAMSIVHNRSLNNLKMKNKALGYVVGAADFLFNSMFGYGAGIDAAAQGIEQKLARNGLGNLKPYNSNSDYMIPAKFSRESKEIIEAGLSPIGRAATDFGLGFVEDSARKFTLGPFSVPIAELSAVGQRAELKGAQGEVNAEKATAAAVAVGTIEYLTKKLPFDKFIKATDISPSNLKEWVKVILSAGLPAAGESMVSKMAGNITDEVINGDKSEFYQTALNYQQQGGNMQDALSKTFLDRYVFDTLKEGMMRFVFSSLMKNITTP